MIFTDGFAPDPRDTSDDVLSHFERWSQVEGINQQDPIHIDEQVTKSTTAPWAQAIQGGLLV